MPHWRKDKKETRKYGSVDGRYLKLSDESFIDLADVEEVKPVNSKPGAFKFAIIFSDGKKRVLGAVDEEDRAKWITALQSQVAFAKQAQDAENVPQRWGSVEGRYLKWSNESFVDLTTVQEIKPMGSTAGAFKFEIVLPGGKKLVLGAADEEDRAKWITNLQSQVDLAKQGR